MSKPPGDEIDAQGIEFGAECRAGKDQEQRDSVTLREVFF